MEDLRKIQSEYKACRLLGCSVNESAKEAVDKALKDQPLNPYIHKDHCGDASHVFINKAVLFFNGGIYFQEENNG